MMNNTVSAIYHLTNSLTITTANSEGQGGDGWMFSVFLSCLIKKILLKKTLPILKTSKTNHTLTAHLQEFKGYLWLK